MSNADVDGLCDKCLRHSCDSMFAFNDSRYSDRVLIIKTITENGVESSCPEERSRLHISSAILASKSPFFLNLFSNGMMETEQRCVTLEINASEETAFMELLKYMYRNTLTVSNAPALLDVFKVADKFQVVSCMRLCAKLLRKLTMNTESAFLYLTSSLPMIDGVQPLIDAAKKFLAVRYKDIEKVSDEIMEMPLTVIEVILGSDLLEVLSEDSVFDLAIKWTEKHFPEPEDQRSIFSAHLCKHIRYPFLSVEKLREVLRCNLLDDDFSYKEVVDALFYKISNTATSHQHHQRRAYKRRPITALQFEFPCQHVVVYFGVKMEEFDNLKQHDLFYEAFNFCGLALHPYARCLPCLGCLTFSVGLAQDKVEQPPLAVRYQLSVMSKGTKMFVEKNSRSSELTGGQSMTLYETTTRSSPQTSFDFIDGVLYFEVKLFRKVP